MLIVPPEYTFALIEQSINLRRQCNVVDKCCRGKLVVPSNEASLITTDDLITSEIIEVN